MNGMNEFIKLFGDVTVINILEFVLACMFVHLVYKRIKEYLINRVTSEEKKNKEFREMLENMKEFSEYRKKNTIYQEKLEEEISKIAERIDKLENSINNRERNKLRDRLLQSYRYYTSNEHNPKKQWTRMEADSFWNLFKDYEEVNGNGYMHSVVQPDMNVLSVIEMDDHEEIKHLMESRR